MDSIFTREKREILNLLEEMINQDSGSFYKEGCDAVGHLLKNQYAALGFDVVTLPEAQHGDHLYITHKEANEPDILIIAHMDTVFPVGTVANRPFTLTEDGIAKGPGIFDMKTSHVQALYAMKSLIEEQHPAYKKVALLLNADEEIGSITSRKYIEQYGKQSKAVLIIEPARGTELTTSRKGGGKFYLSIKGKSSHAGAAPEKGISAVGELGHKIVKLHALNDRPGINVNVGVITGGTSPNTIAPNAEAKIDIRFETQEQGIEVDRLVREILDYSDVPGTELTLTGGITRPAWQADAASMRLFELIRKEGEKLGMSLTPVYSGGGSDGNFTGNLGIPTIDGLGPIGGNAHQADEFLVYSTLETKGELLIQTLKALYSVPTV
ncbi:M20 family metallopeptidase [Marinilactibacillus kalidii]|uniref:M20 family metallopeptidase n=1 Tax=Marinilactibacillus kalidii TaxID=2820274 RepID=UPI001ABEE36A|nr:M20 family metallopeptidase [Marinilactibacillus kalidii]